MLTVLGCAELCENVALALASVPWIRLPGRWFQDGKRPLPCDLCSGSTILKSHRGRLFAACSAHNTTGCGGRGQGARGVDWPEASAAPGLVAPAAGDAVVAPPTVATAAPPALDASFVNFAASPAATSHVPTVVLSDAQKRELKGHMREALVQVLDDTNKLPRAEFEPV